MPSCLPHSVVHHDVVLLGHVDDISEATAKESACSKRADASLWFFSILAMSGADASGHCFSQVFKRRMCIGL